MHYGGFYSIKVDELDLVGTVLDSRYRIDSVLGSGAMGTVFSARHLKLERTVALKLLHRSLLDSAKVRQRFMQEAHAASRLHHPNVVKVYASGVIDGRAFIEMEFLQGESLAELLLREGQLPLDQAISIVSDAAQGLANAHEMGVIHRDVKPSNIMLTAKRGGGVIVQVVDFGVAKILQPEGSFAQSLTATNGAVGTPHYMSPEQCSSQELDARSDIYSLGCVLYQLLSGQTPVQADSPFAAMLAHIQGDIQPLPSMFPEWMISVVNKAVCTDRAQRFQSMAEFIAALAAREIVFSANGGSGSSTKSPSARRSSRRTVLIFFVACTILLLGVWAVKPPGKTEPSNEAQSESLRSEIDGLESQLPNGRFTPESTEVIEKMHKIAFLSSRWLALESANFRPPPPGKVEDAYEWFVVVKGSHYLKKDQLYDVLMEMAAIPGLDQVRVSDNLADAMKTANEQASTYLARGQLKSAVKCLDLARIAGDLIAHQQVSRRSKRSSSEFQRLGVAYYFLLDGKKAELAFTEWERSIEATSPNSAVHADALCYVARSKRLQGKVAEAASLEKKALNMVESLAPGYSKNRALAEVLDIIGQSQWRTGQIAEGIENIERNLAILRQCGASSVEIAASHLMLAEARLQDSTQLDRAEEELNEASKDFGNAGNKLHFAYISKLLGDRYKGYPNRRLEKAQHCYRRGIEAVAGDGTQSGRWNVFWNRVGLADALRIAQHPNEALAVIELCLTAKVSVSDLAEAYGVKACIQAEQKNFKEAVRTYQTELELRRKAGDPAVLSTVAQRAAQEYRCFGNNREADNCLQLEREYALRDQHSVDRIEKGAK